MVRKQFAVIGMGRFGRATARSLAALGHEVLAVDQNEERINDIVSDVTHALIVDVTDDAAMGELGLGNFDTVVVAIGNELQASIMAVVLAKENGAKYVVAKALDDLHAKVLTKVGADKIIMPERDMGARLAQRLVSNNIVDFIELSDEYGFSEMLLPAKWAGKNLRQLDLRAKYGANVVAVSRSGGKMDISPAPDVPLNEGDRLIIIAPSGVMEKIDHMLG